LSLRLEAHTGSAAPPGIAPGHARERAEVALRALGKYVERTVTVAEPSESAPARGVVAQRGVVAEQDESASAGGDATVEKQGAVCTHTLPSVAQRVCATVWGQNVAIAARWANTPLTARCEVFVRLGDGLELPRRSADYEGVEPCATLTPRQVRAAFSGRRERRSRRDGEAARGRDDEAADEANNNDDDEEDDDRDDDDGDDDDDDGDDDDEMVPINGGEDDDEDDDDDGATAMPRILVRAANGSTFAIPAHLLAHLMNQQLQEEHEQEEQDEHEQREAREDEEEEHDGDDGYGDGEEVAVGEVGPLFDDGDTPGRH
jgi:hypothetical protein